MIQVFTFTADPAHEGRGITGTTQEGTFSISTVDGEAIVFQVGREIRTIHIRHAAMIGRLFLMAAHRSGKDLSR